MGYKELRSYRLNNNQSKVLDAICRAPSAHPYSYIRLFPDYKLTAGRIRWSLKKLTKNEIIFKDEEGVWRPLDKVLEAWLYAVKVVGDEEGYALRFGGRGL